MTVRNRQVAGEVVLHGLSLLTGARRICRLTDRQNVVRIGIFSGASLLDIRQLTSDGQIATGDGESRASRTSDITERPIAGVNGVAASKGQNACVCTAVNLRVRFTKLNIAERKLLSRHNTSNEFGTITTNGGVLDCCISNSAGNIFGLNNVQNTDNRTSSRPSRSSRSGEVVINCGSTSIIVNRRQISRGQVLVAVLNGSVKKLDGIAGKIRLHLLDGIELIDAVAASQIEGRAGDLDISVLRDRVGRRFAFRLGFDLRDDIRKVGRQRAGCLLIDARAFNRAEGNRTASNRKIIASCCFGDFHRTKVERTARHRDGIVSANREVVDDVLAITRDADSCASRFTAIRSQRRSRERFGIRKRKSAVVSDGDAFKSDYGRNTIHSHIASIVLDACNLHILSSGIAGDGERRSLSRRFSRTNLKSTCNGQLARRFVASLEKRQIAERSSTRIRQNSAFREGSRASNSGSTAGLDIQLSARGLERSILCNVQDTKAINSHITGSCCQRVGIQRCGSIGG